MCPVMDRPETLLVNRAHVIQTPVIRDHNEILLDIHRHIFVYDQRAVQTACNLFPGEIMRVIPECTCIRDRKAILKRFTGLDGFLCQMGDAIHSIVNTNAMPMYR